MQSGVLSYSMSERLRGSTAASKKMLVKTAETKKKGIIHSGVLVTADIWSSQTENWDLLEI